MGGGGSKRTTDSKSQQYSGSGQQWATPYALDALDEIRSVYDANREALSEQSANARALADRFASDYDSAGNVGGAGKGFYGEVLSGKYLDGNPYLEGIIDRGSRSVADTVNSQFTLAGRYGSGAHTGVLAEKLADMENALRYGNYTTEMDRMMGAAEGSVSADTASAQAKQAAAQTALAQQALAADMPYVGTQSLAAALNALFSGGTGSSTSHTVEKSGGGGLLGGLGSALTGAGSFAKAGGFAALSERKLKTDIVRVGTEPDGLNIYAFDYIWGGPRQLGVMADEVEQLRPWALGPRVDGHRTVYYDRLNKAA